MATSHLDGLDPTGAQTPEDFMALLRQAHAASGLSIVEIAERARLRGYDLDPDTLPQTLEQSTLPHWQTVTGVLTACGLGGMQIDRWMRVFHDLAAPAEPVVPVEPVTAVQERIDVAPVSVPPLVLSTGSATTTRRFGPRHFALAAGALVALLMVPLLWLTLFDREPDTVAAQATGAAPRTGPAAPLPSESPVAQPSPTPTAAPTTPAPVTPTTTKPPTRTTSPPPPTPPSPADSGVLRSGAVELTGNQGFDLDSGQAEGTRDIYRWSSDTLARMNDSWLKPVSGMPSKQSCQAERGWQPWAGNLQAGQWVCVRTSDGRYGRINITAVGGTLKLTYTVWT